MKLSEAIAMVEDWLDMCTYNYIIYKIETDGLKWVIYFYEYSPSNVRTGAYFLVPCKEERRIYNSNEDDVLALSREANSPYPDWIELYDKFEKRWNYGG